MSNIALRPYKHASSFRRIAAVAWAPPADPTVYGTVEVRAEPLLAWIDLKRHETGERITITHAVVRALAMSLRKHPDCNAIVRWGRLQLREDVDIFAQVAVEGGDKVGSADLSGVVIRKADQKDVLAISNELRGGSARIRRDEDPAFKRTKSQAMNLPGWLMGPALRLIAFLQYSLNIDTTFLGAPRDPFGSAMVTSLGMMGIRMGFAPFFPLAAVPIVLLVGAVEDRAVVEDGQVVPGKVLLLNATCDHRIIDGYHAAKLAYEMKVLLENPRLLESDADRARAMGPAERTAELPTLDLDTVEHSTTVEMPTVPGDPNPAQDED